MESRPMSPLGTRRLGAIVCLWEETKIGALLPGMEGRLGIDITLVPSSGSVLFVGSAVLILLNFDLLLVLKFASLSC